MEINMNHSSDRIMFKTISAEWGGFGLFFLRSKCGLKASTILSSPLKLLSKTSMWLCRNFGTMKQSGSIVTEIE